MNIILCLSCIELYIIKAYLISVHKDTSGYKTQGITQEIEKGET